MPARPRIEELKRRIERDPASIAFAALAEEYRRAGQYEDAIATSQTGLQRHPAYLSARVTLGRSLLELGRYDEARQELQHVLQVAPDNLAAIRGLAEIHHRTGEFSEQEPAGTGVPHKSELPQTDTARASEAPVAAPEPSPIRPSEPAPIRPVRLSALPGREQANEQTANERTSEPRSSELAKPVTSRPVESAPAEHPDRSALPALESFLAAIVRARESMRPEGSSEP